MPGLHSICSWSWSEGQGCCVIPQPAAVRGLFGSMVADAYLQVHNACHQCADSPPGTKSHIVLVMTDWTSAVLVCQLYIPVFTNSWLARLAGSLQQPSADGIIAASKHCCCSDSAGTLQCGDYQLAKLLPLALLQVQLQHCSAHAALRRPL